MKFSISLPTCFEGVMYPIPFVEPGDFVLLPEATWENQTVVFRGKGTPEKPITFRASNPGKFVLTGKSHLVVEGEWLVVEGMTLRNAGADDVPSITAALAAARGEAHGEGS